MLFVGVVPLYRNFDCAVAFQERDCNHTLIGLISKLLLGWILVSLNVKEEYHLVRRISHADNL